MNLANSIEPVSILKTKSAELIRRTHDSGQPIIITQGGKAKAVLQDVESYQKQRQALLLLKFLAKGDKEIQQGKSVSHRQALKHFENTLKDLHAK